MASIARNLSSTDPNKGAVKVVMPSERNKHVWEYLEYYTAFSHPPRYAVLINGPWGIGKTFLVKRFLEAHYAKRSEEYVYLSLFGLSSLEEIDDALMAAIYPALQSKSAKTAGRVLKSALKFWGVESDLKVNEFLSKFKANLYVFDDLERCNVEINQILGYINEFVEHDNCKVVIVTNEKEIVDIDEYRRRREKLIGKTLEVESAFEEALGHFISLLDPGTMRFIQGKVDNISAIFSQSQLGNLRILQQTIWDFERVFKVLTKEHRANDAALSVLLQMFFALSFEVKSGRIRSVDLQSRMNQIVGMMMNPNNEAQPTPLQIAAKRYLGTNLEDSILSDELLVDILLRGIVSATEIRASLDRSSYYVNPKNETAWRILWHGLDRSEEDFDRAFAQVEHQYAAREFTITGEILQVFGLRLWLSDIGALKRTRAETVEEGRAYIDDLYRAKLLNSAADDVFDARFSGYGGLAIYGTDSPEYRELFHYLIDRQKKAEADRYPEEATKLLEELQADPDLYFRRLSGASSSDGTYQRIPILAYIDPDRFVDLVLQQEPARQRVILMAFKARYGHGELGGELAEEAPWLLRVRDRLVSKASSMSQLGKFRTGKFVEWFLDPFLEQPAAGEIKEAKKTRRR